MDFCSICATLFDPDDRRIRCSDDRCKLTFHERCILLATCEDFDDDDFFWLCPTCQVELTPRSRRRHDEDQPLEEPASKRIRVDQIARLPPEVWEMVFENLASRWLARVRLVCREWSDIVASRPNLMDKFWLNLGTKQLAEERNEVRSFLLFRAGGYARAKFDFINIKQHLPRINWFKVLGQTLHTLQIKSYGLALMLQVLKELPNLKQLDVTIRAVFKPFEDPNFRLEKLEKLTIHDTFSSTHGSIVFRTFECICPRLIGLQLCWNNNQTINDDLSKEIASFVSAVSKTLQILEMFAPKKVIKELVKLDGLQLKQLSIYCNESGLIEFVQRLPTLEFLQIRRMVEDLSILDDMTAHLPNLKILQLPKVNQPNCQLPASLSTLEHLKLLLINNSGYASLPKNFYKNCHSQRLDLVNVNLTTNTFTNLSQMTTVITSIRLRFCTTERPTAILSLIQQSTKLSTIDIFKLKFSTYTKDQSSTSANPLDSWSESRVRSLTITVNSRPFLRDVLKRCPNLERIVEGCGILNAKLLRAMAHYLRKLKVFKLRGKLLTREGLEIIASGDFAELKVLRIYRCVLSRETVREVLHGKLEGVDVKIDYAAVA